MNFGIQIIAFLSHYFEEVVYTLVGIFSLALGLTIVNQFRGKSVVKNIRSFTDTIIGTILICLILFGACLIGAIYWNNYKSPFIDYELHEQILPSVHWVKDDLRIHVVNENELLSLKINGKDQKSVFISKDPIRDFQFSPDGQNILIATYKQLYIYNTQDQTNWLVDSISFSEDQKDLKGTISGIQWAPNSQHFLYEVARWSKYGSKDQIYVYDLQDRSKRVIDSPIRKISTLYWDMDSQNMYFIKSESQELLERELIYKMKVFRIDMDQLNIHFVTDIATDDSKFPVHHFEILNISLYQPEKSLTFGRIGQLGALKSSTGEEVGIDERSYFYYKRNWFRKRLFRVKREVDSTQKATLLNTHGEHVLQQIRWTPSGDYVIMDHPYWGILILDPRKRKIGQLYPYEVSTYGWYSEK